MDVSNVRRLFASSNDNYSKKLFLWIKLEVSKIAFVLYVRTMIPSKVVSFQWRLVALHTSNRICFQSHWLCRNCVAKTPDQLTRTRQSLSDLFKQNLLQTRLVLRNKSFVHQRSSGPAQLRHSADGLSEKRYSCSAAIECSGLWSIFCSRFGLYF